MLCHGTARRWDTEKMSLDSSPIDVEQIVRLFLLARWRSAALEPARGLVQRAGFDWDLLLRYVQERGVTQLVYRAVRDQDWVPAMVEQNLREVSHQDAIRDLLVFHELESVLRSLADRGVSLILLKGAALARTVYAEAGVRPMGDLGLLVQRHDVPAAEAVLEAVGYLPLDVETRAGIDLLYRHSATLQRVDILVTLIELHWSLFAAQYYQHKLPMDWFWQTAIPVRVGSASTLVLGPEAQLLHLCAHLVLHHEGTELLWLNDIAEVISHYQGQIDWEQLLDRAQAYDLLLPLQQLLPHVAGEWQAPVPGSVLEELQARHASPAERRVFAWLTVRRRTTAQRFCSDLLGIPGWGKRLHFLWTTLFPSSTYMQRRYGIRHPLLLPLYYPYHWLLSLRILPPKGGLQAPPKGDH